MGPCSCSRSFFEGFNPDRAAVVACTVFFLILEFTRKYSPRGYFLGVKLAFPFPAPHHDKNYFVIEGLLARTPVSHASNSNPFRNPLLQAKAVDGQPSNDRFERTTCWVPCAHGIKLQLLCSVRFWTSLARTA